MQLVSNCTAIAALLSAKYRHYNRSDAIASDDYISSVNGDNILPVFLRNNGLVVTMCMRFPQTRALPWLECSQPKLKKQLHGRLSASWVQQEQTAGLAVIGWPLTQVPPVGLVLDPSTMSTSSSSSSSSSSLDNDTKDNDDTDHRTILKLTCIYPADGATDERDEGGCGPLSADVKYGSHGYDQQGPLQQWATRQQIQMYKNQNFGSVTPWGSIPCCELFAPFQNQTTAESPPPPHRHLFWPSSIVGKNNGSNNNTNRYDMGVFGTLANHNKSNDSTLSVLRKGLRRDNGIGSNALATENKQQQDWLYSSPWQHTIDQWQHIMGHAVCNASEPAPGPNFGHDDHNDNDNKNTNRNNTLPASLIYIGPQSWNVTSMAAWDDMLQWMQRARDEHSHLHLWNELLFDIQTTTTPTRTTRRHTRGIPREQQQGENNNKSNTRTHNDSTKKKRDDNDALKQVVQAVFYIPTEDNLIQNQIAEWEARRQAQKWNKPLLKVHPAHVDATVARSRNGNDSQKPTTQPQQLATIDLFQCVDM